MGLDFLTPKMPALIGLDVDNAFIRMVELSMGRDGPCLERYAIVSVPPGAMADQTMVDEKAMSEALAKCRSMLGSKIKNVATSLPSSSIVTFRMTVQDGMRQDELDAMVMSEANGRLQSGLESMSIDYQPLRHLASGADGSIEIDMLVAATLRERVEHRVALVEAGGMKALVVDSDRMALLDCVEQALLRQGHDLTDRVVLVMNVLAHSTAFYFVRNEDVVYEREHSIGTDQLSQELASVLGVDMAKADLIRLGKTTVDNAAMVGLAKNNFIESLTHEAQRAVQLFMTSVDLPGINSLVLLGQGVNLPSVSETLERSLQVPCQVGNPFSNMRIGSDVDSKQLFLDAPALAVACGLAMRRFDK